MLQLRSSCTKNVPVVVKGSLPRSRTVPPVETSYTPTACVPYNIVTVDRILEVDVSNDATPAYSLLMEVDYRLAYPEISIIFVKTIEIHVVV